jgi:hypothetical protein
MSWIWTHDPSVRASKDSSCLRPRSYCDRLQVSIPHSSSFCYGLRYSLLAYGFQQYIFSYSRAYSLTADYHLTASSWLINFSQSQSQNYFTPGCLLPISSTWLQVPWGSQYFFQLNPCDHNLCVTSSLDKGWGCLLWKYLAFVKNTYRTYSMCSVSPSVAKQSFNGPCYTASAPTA